jgi:HK97 gp10 family phage protein
MADRFVFDEKGLAELFESPAGPTGKMLLRRATRIERGAKRGAPVDTGRLRSSITHSLERDVAGLVAVVGTDVDYAPFVELGTSRAAAQPFLRPALATEMGRE